MSVRESRFTAPLSVVDASTATTAVDSTGRRALTMEQYSCDKYDRPPLRAVCRSERDLSSSACGYRVVDGGGRYQSLRATRRFRENHELSSPACDRRTTQYMYAVPRRILLRSLCMCMGLFGIIHKNQARAEMRA